MRKPLTWAGRLLPVAVAAVVAGLLVVTLDPVSKPGGQPAPLPGPVATTAQSHGPNIVEFLVDDMRSDDLAYMPNVRRLIGDHGLTMENMFSSYPLCCPARASFFSGQLPHNHHVWTVNKPYAYSAFDDSRTIATSLHSVGYHTGLTGKYLNGYGSMKSQGGWRLEKKTVEGRTRYVRTWVSSPKRYRSAYKIPDGWDQWHAFLDDASGVHNLKTGQPVHGGTYHFFDVAASDNGNPISDRTGTYSSRIVGDDTMRMLDTFDRSSKPFFLSVNFPAPHQGSGNAAEKRRDAAAHLDGLPTTASPRWTWHRFDKVIKRASGVLPNGMTEQDANGDGRDTAADVADKPRRFGKLPGFSPWKVRAIRETARQRAESLYATDKQIGRVIERLKATGEYRHTVIVFWSDNGYFQGEHHRAAGKILEYNPVIRVPLLITGPGMRKRENRWDPLDVVDLTATLLDFARAPAPRTPDGVSYRNVLLHGDKGWSTGVPYEEGWMMPGPASKRHHDPDFPLISHPARFMHQRHVDGAMGQGVKTGRYMYVRFGDGSEELYDEAKDPLEMNNVALSPTYARVKAQLRAVAEQLMHCTGMACRATLPPDLRMSPAAERRSGEKWWGTSYRVYGNAMQRAYWDQQRRF